jgi:hypothetical protein
MTVRDTWIVAIFLITLVLWISASELIGGWISIE